MPAPPVNPAPNRRAQRTRCRKSPISAVTAGRSLAEGGERVGAEQAAALQEEIFAPLTAAERRELVRLLALIRKGAAPE